MTKEEFKSLKVGDRVYIPYSSDRKTFLSTEVLKIDNFFSHVTVLLGKKPYSYRYISKNNKSSSFFVGTYKI